MRDRESMYPKSRRLGLLGDGKDGVLGTGDDDGVWAVDRRDADAVTQQRPDLGFARRDGHHGAALGQPLHEPAACRHQGGRVLQ